VKIDRIEFEAIGPFAGYFDINLNELGEDSALFLIDGPTGAGKSTILDAITYAIYGETSGADSDKSRMRSQFAKPTQESYVRVTFSTPNGTFRIRRSPDFEMPKSRGEGTRKINGTAQFQKLDGSNKWVTEFEQIRESNTAALAAVGLTKTQFAQTVLLPQGEFDKFLKSDSKDRQELLSRIFNTGRFTKLREALKARAKKIESDKAAINEVVSQRASTISTIFGMFDDDAETVKKMAEDIGQTDELFAFLENYETEVKEFLVTLKADLKKAEANYKKATSDLELRNRELAAKTALDTAQAEAKTSADALNVFIKEALSQAKSHKFELLEGDSWQSRAKKVAAIIDRLSDLLELEESLEERLEEVDVREQKLTAAIELLTGYESQSTSLPAEKEKLEKEKKELKTEAEKVGKLTAEVDSLNEIAEVISNLENLSGKLPKAETKATNAAKQATEAENLRHALVASRLANMAGEIAQTLVPGEPCEVCGSKEHPNPKKLAKSTASQEEIENAESEATRLSKLAETARQELATLKTQIDSVTKNLKVKPDEFEAKFEKVSADLEIAVKAASRILEIEADVQIINDKIQANQALLVETGTAVATQKTELAALKKSNETDLKKMSTQASPYKTIAEKLDSTEELADAINAVVTAEVNVSGKTAVIADRQKDLDKLDKSAEFAKPEKAQEALNESKPIYEQLLIRVSDSEGCLENYTPALKKLKDAVADRTKLLSGSEQIQNLSKLADGENPYRQPIDTFVLQSMFKQVLVAGNLRFQNLLEGRYSFVLDELGSDKRSAQGLGLSVLDRNTGETRNTKTLSGGEAFCASLSLALGLSDIVRSESGGLAIDTFFIDEGFGSLDGERLNQVNNMLSRLQAEGRTIGLISHVAEMKETISEKIDVKPSKSEGPSTLTVNWMLP
jgi:exonuclease SbcC